VPGAMTKKEKNIGATCAPIWNRTALRKRDTLAHLSNFPTIVHLEERQLPAKMRKRFFEGDSSFAPRV